MRFGEKLKLALDRYDTTQKDFAKRVNISPSTLCGYINTDRQPDFELVKRIASELNVTVDYLLDYNQAPENELITNKEQKLLNNYRSLDKEKQEIIFKLAEMLTKK